MTREQAVEFWEKHSTPGIFASVTEAWNGTPGDKDPRYAVHFEAENLSGRKLTELLTEVSQSDDLDFSVDTGPKQTILLTVR